MASQKRFVIIFPIFFTILIFSSVAGIIGNSIFLSDNSANRSFTISNLDTGEIRDRSVSIPEKLNDLEIKVSIFYFSDLDLNDPKAAVTTIYVAKQQMPSSLDTQDKFLNSSYYKESVIDRSEGIGSSENFYLSGDYSQLYFIFANEGTKQVSFTVNMSIKSSTSGLENTGRILGIIFSSLLTVFFIIGSVYLWLEFTENIEVRFLTQELEDKLDEIQTNAYSWELVVVAIAGLAAISGYSQLLLGTGGGNLIIALIAGGIVFANYNKRLGLQKNIRTVITQHHRIALKELADMIGESEKDVKKGLLDAIMYAGFPASYDFKTDIVTYDPSGVRHPQNQVEVEETVSESAFQVASTEVESPPIEENDAQPSRPKPKCAYCDAEAINVNAQFCHNCGASMSSAK